MAGLPTASCGRERPVPPHWLGKLSERGGHSSVRSQLLNVPPLDGIPDSPSEPLVCTLVSPSSQRPSPQPRAVGYRTQQSSRQAGFRDFRVSPAPMGKYRGGSGGRVRGVRGREPSLGFLQEGMGEAG